MRIGKRIIGISTRCCGTYKGNILLHVHGRCPYVTMLKQLLQLKLEISTWDIVYLHTSRDTSGEDFGINETRKTVFSHPLHHNCQTIDMAKIRRCPTCKVLFPTIDVVNDHYKQTSHIPLPYRCESCEKVYEKLSPLLKVGIQLSILIDYRYLRARPMKHIRSKHSYSLSYYCKYCKRVSNFKNLPNVRIQCSVFMTL